MTVNEIISQRYQDLKKLLKNTDVLIFNGLCYDDLLNNILITQLKKYRGIDLDPEEGFEAIKHAVLTEFLFIPKKKKPGIVVLADDYFVKAKKPEEEG